MPARYFLRSLGEPALFTVAGRPAPLRTRKALALLVYLAVERRAHQRDVLSDLLWPKANRSDGRHSLANALSDVRRRLGSDAVESTPERVRLRDGALQLDLERLLAGDVLGSETAPPLSVDGFLEGLEFNDAVRFGHWRSAQQARLLPHIREALVRQIERCRRTGDFRGIEPLAERLQRFDDLSEEAVRALMEARAFAGDRLSALRVFETWKLELATQLGAAPSDLLEGMALRLRRRGWERPSSSDIPSVPTDHWRGQAFVGRAREYETLYESWEAAQRGDVAHRLVLGDSGIGKTTLVQRLLTAVGLEGATAARVQCHEIEREIPYAAISNLITQLIERPGSSAAPPDALAELAQSIPAVRRKFPVLPPPVESQGETARIRFTEATHALLTALAEEHPVVLALDDVHHCDDVSLAVLHLIIRHAVGEPFLVVFIARPGELHQSPQAARLRDAGFTLGIQHLEVPPLTEDESGELLTALVAERAMQPSATVRRALLRAAAGIPHVLELLVRDWERSGELSLALSIDAMTTEPGSGPDPEQAYRLLFERLLQVLDPIARNVLTLAAILGPRLNDPAMYTLADLTLGHTLLGFSELRAAHLLRDAGDGLEFSNELLRAHAYVATPAGLRRVLHSRIADRLLAEAAQGDDTLGLDIAWHCIRGGRQEEAIPHLLSGARQAIWRGAVHDAERRLASAMPMLVGEPRREASVTLALLLQEQGRWEESLHALRLHDDVPQSCAGKLVASVANIYTTAGSQADLERNAEEALESMELVSNSDELLAVARFSNKVSNLLRDPHTCARLETALGRRALLVPASLGVQHEVQLARIKLRYYSNKRDGLILDLRELARSANAATTANTLCTSIHVGLGALYIRNGQYQEAERCYLKALELARRLDSPSLTFSVLSNLTVCHSRLGAPGRVLEVAHRAELVRQDLNPYCEVQLTYHKALALIALGRGQEVPQVIEQVGVRLGRGTAAWVDQAWGLSHTDLLYVQGEEDSAREVGWRVVGPSDGPKISAYAGAVARIASWNLCIPDRRERARELIVQVRDLDHLDALDVVETLGAELCLVRRDRDSEREQVVSEKLRAAAVCLPATTLEQLQMLGATLV